MRLPAGAGCLAGSGRWFQLAGAITEVKVMFGAALRPGHHGIGISRL